MPSFTMLMKRGQSLLSSSTERVQSVFTRNWPTKASKPAKPSIVGIKYKGYQKAAIKFGLSRPAAGLFLAPGLGKTLITLTIFKILKKMGLVDELLVVAKRRIIYNVWRQEIQKWGFSFSVVILHGPKKRQMLKAPADVRLINYEGLAWLSRQKRFFSLGVRRMLALDESSKVKHTNTLRFRSLKKILQFFDRRYILTGSPAAKGLINLFGQIYVLDYGEALGAFITKFRNDYFYPSGFMGYKWSLQRGAKKRIYDRIRPLVIRFGTDQLKMPPLTFIDKWVKLPKLARRQYDELEREHLLEYRDGAIVAANAAVATNKLRQLTNGGAYYSPLDGVILDERGKKIPPKWRTIHEEKCAELVELLEELQGEPALVSFEFQHDKYRLQRYLKKHAPQFTDAPFIDGKAKDRDVTRWLEAWNKGALPVIFGHMTSVAYGLNLQGKGGIVIFFAMTYSLEDYEQFIQRVWRQGQERRVIVYRILARDTVDEDMVSVIEQDDHNQTDFLEAMSAISKRVKRREKELTA